MPKQLSAISNVLSSVDDHELMRKVQLGDVGSFQKLYERYKGPIMSYVFHMVANKSTAEEITQEVFLRVYKHASTYSPDAKFTTWLWTLARNLTYDYYRKKTEVLLQSGEEAKGDPFDQLESPLSDAETLLVQQATREQLEHCLDELSAPQKEAMVLRTFSEISYDEIATMLKVSVSSVKSLLFRAKNALMNCMQGGKHE